MKSNNLKLLFLFLFASFLLNCASRREIVQFQDDTVYLRNQVDALRSENRELKAMVQQLNTTVIQQQEELQRTRADLMVELKTIRDQSQFLDNKLEDNIQRMSRNIHRSSLPQYSPLPMDSSLQNSGFNESDLNPNQLYNTAYKDLIRGSYPLALEGFRQFLFNFPNSEMADDAQYWIAEAFYSQENYIIAFEEFKILITKYPESQMVPPALLKMAYCSNKRGDKRTALKYFDILIRDYPNSEEAKLAKENL
jgi:tol-pal system protein YbgF